jgi:hypothetical protein
MCKSRPKTAPAPDGAKFMLARRLPAIWRRVENLDVKAGGLPRGSIRRLALEAQARAASLESDAIDEQIDALPVETLADAAVTIMMASLIAETAQFHPEKGWEYVNRIRKMLAGALTVVADAAGFDPRDIAADIYMGVGVGMAGDGPTTDAVHPARAAA